jgi:hypothetical protein
VSEAGLSSQERTKTEVSDEADGVTVLVTDCGLVLLKRGTSSVQLLHATYFGSKSFILLR